MPEIKLKGLRGLDGLSSLTPEEQYSFMSAHADQLNAYRNPRQRKQAANILYMNQKFINTFGEDAFNKMNDGSEEAFNQRNTLVKNKIALDAFQQKFGEIGSSKHPFTTEVANQLDAQGMIDLLNNQEYLGPVERQKIYQKNLNAAKKVGKTYDKAINNPYADALGTGYMQWGKTASALTPSQIDAQNKKRDDDILNKLYAETQERREKESQRDIDMVYANMLNLDDSGQKSLAQSYKEFDKLATENSSYYKTFKNSKWMKDYSNENRLKDYAKFLVLKQKYGEMLALKYLEQSMQNRVADAQDGKWTGNTLKGVLTTTWSDLGSNVALFANVGKSAEEMAILNQGKDPNKPIYDKKGNIVDYQRNDDWVTNPAYWNNVYKYNTFSPTEIKAIEERGGISEDVNVRRFGYTPDFFSWDTLEEGFKQSGHIGAGIIETALTGAAGKLVGWAGKGAMNLIGMSAKAMQTASKVGKITNNFLVGATTGLEGSQLEAMGTFDDQMQTAREKIQAQIKKELYDYQRSINYNSNAAKLEIGNIYRQLKAQDNKRVARNSREGVTAFPMSDDVLRNQAKQLYTNQLLANKQQQLQELHKKDELEAARAAEKAYATNFVFDYIKNIPLTVGIQKYKIAKGAMRSSFDNTLKKSLAADTETGGVKRNAVRYSSGKKLGKAMAKQFLGGFADEYLDGLNASFSSGIGNNEFDNYIKKTYDPKAYSSTVDTMLGNMLAGMSEGIDGITDRQNLYEGFIGAVSPIASTTVNHNAAFRPKDTWRALIGGKDSYGNKLNKAERLSTVLMNPLLDTYVEAKEKDRNIDRSVDVINAVVAANKDKIQDASKIISVLGNYEGELNVGDTPYSILDSKDNKLHNAFTLLNVLGTLENMDGGTYTNLYKETIDTMEGLANGTLKKEQMDAEIDRFLADDNNKSLLDDADKDEEGNVKAKEFAAKKLQENAKYFMDMKKRLDDIRNTFAYSSSLKNVKPEVRELLAYNIVAGEDYKKRLQGLEEELGVSSTDTDTLYKPDYNIRYGTPQARNRAVKGRERQIDKLQKEIDEHKKIAEKAQKKEATLKEELKSTSDDNKIKEIKGSLKREQTSYQTNEFARKALEEEKRKLTQEKDEISKITTGSDFNESTILNADARDRAWILDPKNRDNFSKEVQAIIDNVTSTLKQKNPDALDKVRDAGILAQRVEDMRNVYNKILDNNELAATYLDAVSDLRDRAALADTLQRDIDNYYSEVGEAYVNKRQDPQGFKNAIIYKSTDFLDAYMEDHPNQVNDIQSYYDMAKFDRIATAYIHSSDASEEVKKEMQAILVALNDTANTREELEKGLEEIIDSSEFSPTTRKRLDTLLDDMRKFGYQRDSTVVEERKKRQQREEEEKKKKEEEKKKLDEETKKAAEKKAEEDKSKATETIDGVDFSKADVDEESMEFIDLGLDNAESKDNANAKSSEVKEKKPTEENKEKESTTINYDKPFTITSGEYEDTQETAKHEENAEFEVLSSVKDGDNTYFIGNFAGSNEQTKVKAKKDVIENDTVGQQKEETVVQGNTVNDDVEVIDDAAYGKSPSLEKQAEEATAEGKNVVVSDVTEDVNTLNSTSEYKNNTEETTLTGNTMSMYQPKPLVNDGIIKIKVGEKVNDTREQYNAWMKDAGINLQNIIDHELARIIKRNPHAKVKFMSIKPAVNATNDKAMQNHYMLALDYDDKVNKGITSIHNDSNGGVVESQGKKYLIIGIAGYGNMNQGKLKLYKRLFNNTVDGSLKIPLKRKEFFDKHPEERFYVNDEYSTEVVPYSLIPGYIVKQTLNDDAPKNRSVRELLADKKRNPLGYTMENVAWGIQEASKFLLVGTTLDNVMIPRNDVGNRGSAFILMPASNGKLVPSYLKVLKYTEMNSGALKNNIDSLLQTIVGPNYDNAIKAIVELHNILYLDKNGDDILRRKTRNEVSLVHDGKIYKTFTMDDTFDRNAFVKAFEEINPRINITARVLGSQDMLKVYDEAGALNTDAALFGTAGSSFTVYGINTDGTMITSETPTNELAKNANQSDFKNDKRQVIYNKQYYIEDNGTYTLNGTVITDENLIKQLNYNSMIRDGELVPAISEGVYDSFILNGGDNPQVIKVNRNTKEVKELSKEQSKEIVDKINEQKAKEQREKAAEKTITSEDKIEVNEDSLQSVDLDNSEFTVDPNTGEVIQFRENKAEDVTDDSIKGTEETKESKTPNNTDSDETLESPDITEHKMPTQKLTDLLKSKTYKVRIRKMLSKKWKDIPTKSSELEKFLRDKNIEVDAIGTSKEDIEAWIKTIVDCR